MAEHNFSQIREIPANENGRGNLAGFSITCTCGFEASSTIRVAVEFDSRSHLEWVSKKARKGGR